VACERPIQVWSRDRQRESMVLAISRRDLEDRNVRTVTRLDDGRRSIRLRPAGGVRSRPQGDVGHGGGPTRPTQTACGWSAGGSSCMRFLSEPAGVCFSVFCNPSKQGRCVISLPCGRRNSREPSRLSPEALASPVGLPQHPNEHRPERPALLAVNQARVIPTLQSCARATNSGRPGHRSLQR
jgi:hypothetical protein